MASIKHYQVQQTSIELALAETVFEPSQHGRLFAEHLPINNGERVIDIGCGAGILAIYAALQGAQVWATDISADAVALTEANARRNGVSVMGHAGGFFAGLSEKLDVIVANLPQEIVASQHASQLGAAAMAIDGGQRGNDLVLELLRQAPDYMHPESRLYLPLHTLSDYQHTLTQALRRYHVSLVAMNDLPVKAFVTDNLTFYQELAQAGVMRIFERNDVWYSTVYVIELRLKKSENR
ncbi:methyltransferase [Idiomarina xiamenensis]|uniref:Methylase n=1 Tax=Idiomarina xiamenensis 10-D-4 TaxID=740709 RepID=K2JHS6_9GAMM|nr:class I SAM-dependent methyltransferase [Idiomarina xiamenensis]EKE82936.1 methylase [Idiomarina xiamenensis 10-D-4]